MQNVLLDLRKHMQDSIGVMHETAFNPKTSEEPQKMPELEEHFCFQISQTAKDFEMFTTHLPNLNASLSMQEKDVKEKQAENELATLQLQTAVTKAKAKLQLIRSAIETISASFFLDDVKSVKPSALPASNQVAEAAEP